eukprot:4575283-Amphidinium_carterae.1
MCNIARPDCPTYRDSFTLQSACIDFPIVGSMPFHEGASASLLEESASSAWNHFLDRHQSRVRAFQQQSMCGRVDLKAFWHFSHII